MFKQKRLVRVEVTLKHGSGKENIKEVIEILPGQTFTKGIGADTIREHGTIVRQFDWIAGYTMVYEYFYV